MTKKKLYLIDASGYIFRAYYAIRPLSNSKGLPTNALFGFTSMLLKLLRDEKPDLVGVVFDVARKTFRNEKFAAYKANRAEPPPDLVPQFPYFRKIVKALNLPVLELPNYEADDVIGTIAKKMEAKKISTVIVTGDKDLMQLVDDGICIYDSMKDKWIRAEEVKERFGVEPACVTDVLGLSGDTSDNIPGIPGIGEKTAIKLIQEYGSLESTLAHAKSIKGKLGEKLQEFADQARLCKELATIEIEVPIQYDLKDFQLGEPDHQAIKTLFEELEFRKFLSELAPQKTLSAKDYHLVLSEEELEKIAAKLKNCRGFAFDTETTSLDTMKADLVGLSLSCQAGEAYYIPVGHLYLGVPAQLSWELIKRYLKPVLEDPKIPKYAQNAKYDYEILKRHGVTVAGLAVDTLIAAYLLNPETIHNLDQLAHTYLEHKTTTYEEVTGTGKAQINFSEVTVETARDYSGEDADVTFRLTEILVPQLHRQNLMPLFEEIEIPLITVLAKMEMTGVKVDTRQLKKTSAEYAILLKDIEQKVYEEVGCQFNLNSPKQLADVLFEKMKLPPIRKTKTGYSTDVEVLTELAKGHEVPKILLQHRSLSKLKSTYLDALVEIVNPETGRIHTSFNQTIAATGRLSSSDPNLQNIPIRSEEGRRIREAFIAEKGNRLLSADYSQIELRILAHLSHDKTLLEAFAAEKDIHRATAAKIFDVSESEVTHAMRSAGKTVNFAVLYGQGAFSLSQQLEVDIQEAEKYIQNYFAQHAGVKSLKETILAQAREQKLVRTLFGRLRHFPDIESSNKNVRSMAERVAFNTVFQGTAADLIKKAMIRIHGRIEEAFPQAKMIIQVHDELVFEVPEKMMKAFSSMVKEEMEGVAKLAVPLKVDVGVGDNWAQAH